MADEDKRFTVSVEELTLSNALQLTVLVELLEEKGILTKVQVIERVKTIRKTIRWALDWILHLF